MRLGIRMRLRDDGEGSPLFLVNGQEEPKIKRDETYLYQPEIIVEGPDGTATSSARKLAWAGAKCWRTTKAAPLSMGMAAKKSSKRPQETGRPTQPDHRDARRTANRFGGLLIRPAWATRLALGY